MLGQCLRPWVNIDPAPAHISCSLGMQHVQGTLLSLIDEPVRLLKERHILHAGSFVMVRFVN